MVYTVLYMFGIILNASARLVQMSHSQRIKPKRKKVFKNLEITCTQRRVCLPGKFHPAQKV